MATTVDLALLPPLEVPSRIGRLAPLLRGAGCEGLLVTKLENIRYLTGFSGSAAMLLVTETSCLLTTDGRYAEQAPDQLEAAGVSAEVEIGRLDAQLEALKKATSGLSGLGLEASSVSWALELRLADALSLTPVPTRGLIETLRVQKDAGELARIERACDIADVALAQVKARLLEEPSEQEFAAELEYEMRQRGSSGPAFETIVASGPNSAMPHARPTARIIAAGEPVVIDFGATVDGYRSDVTRTLCVGALDTALQDVLEAVLAAERAGVRAVGPGVSGGEVDDVCRASLTDAGFGPAFLHATGHGVGLEIHEAPAVGPGAPDILPVGAVVTVEPGAYLKGRGGARIEDTVVVLDNGCRPLTKSTKDYTL